MSGMVPYRVVQNAFLVDDLDATVAQLTARAGYGPWAMLRNIEIPKKTYLGVETTYRYSAALTQAGAVQVEVVAQHDDEPSCYRHVYPRGSGGFHHTALFVDDFDAAIGAYEAARLPLVQLNELPGGTRAGFVDTRSINGHMIEVLQESRGLRDLYTTVAELARTHPPHAVVDLGPIAEAIR